jgi:hypothetical protein
MWLPFTAVRESRDAVAHGKICDETGREQALAAYVCRFAVRGCQATEAEQAEEKS